MKKLFFLLICFVFIGSFTFAKGPQKSLKTFLPQQVSGRALHEKSFKQTIPSFSGKNQSRLTPETCLTGDKALAKQNLLLKTQQAINQLSGLVVSAEKVNYDAQNIVRLVSQFQKLSSQISQDCTVSAFKTHSQQIKSSLTSLKKELNLFKKYVLSLRQK